VQLHLAQLNVATLRHPIDHPATAPFTEALPLVNSLGEAAPGFVWRLQTEDGDATSISAFPNPLTIVNLTVWQSGQALRDFVYRGTHRDFFRRRAEWFEAGSQTAMWWLPAGTTPTVDDAKARLEFIDRFGPSPYAFEMGQQFPQLVIVRRDLDHPDVAPMIEQLNRELLDSEPDGGICFHSLAADEVRDGGGFFVAYLDGTPSACGAYRRIDGMERSAEVKRMWAHPDTRGSKLGAAILATIVGAATADGYRALQLETGEHLTAAVGLYTRVGFQPCPPWGEYTDSPLSHCLRLELPA
jgi:GNAT superfamily N-acetyltransferase